MEAALYYYRRRYYSPRLGRFLSRDPLPLITAAHLYEYVDSKTTDYTDAWGLVGTSVKCPVVDEKCKCEECTFEQSLIPKPNGGVKIAWKRSPVKGDKKDGKTVDCWSERDFVKGRAEVWFEGHDPTKEAPCIYPGKWDEKICGKPPKFLPTPVGHAQFDPKDGKKIIKFKADTVLKISCICLGKKTDTYHWHVTHTYDGKTATDTGDNPVPVKEGK